jgi:hypothetical protein
VAELQRFWALDVGIFDSSRTVAQARTTSRDSAEITGRAVRAGAVPSGQVRGLIPAYA